MKFIILAGGEGKRFWPLSRKKIPKQFLKLPFLKGESFYQRTLRRFSRYKDAEFLILTNKLYKFHALKQAEEIMGKNCPLTILEEPSVRNTAPAITLGLRFFFERGVSRDEVFFISPSDHLIEPEEEFIGYMEKAESLAKKDKIITFGIKPLRPETGFGYIKVKGKDEGGFFEVERFVEKPDEEKAKLYLKDGNYYWNSGMFIFRGDVFEKELKLHSPQIAEILMRNLSENLERYSRFPDISIDYALMEKTNNILLIPLNLSWSDAGSFDSLYEILEKDGMGNVKWGNVMCMGSRENMILGGKKFFALLNMEGVIVVDGDDSVLIARRGSSQHVKDLVEILEKEKRYEVEEGSVDYRPWGSYKVLEEGENFKVKIISVEPGGILSLQRHKYRSEHWIIVSGKARVTLDGKNITLEKNDHIFIPCGSYHRLENPEKDPLELIEVQVGTYLGEDDVERVEDIYGRK